MSDEKKQLGAKKKRKVELDVRVNADKLKALYVNVTKSGSAFLKTLGAKPDQKDVKRPAIIDDDPVKRSTLLAKLKNNGLNAETTFAEMLKDGRLIETDVIKHEAFFTSRANSIAPKLGLRREKKGAPAAKAATSSKKQKTSGGDEFSITKKAASDAEKEHKSPSDVTAFYKNKTGLGAGVTPKGAQLVLMSAARKNEYVRMIPGAAKLFRAL